MIIVPKKKEPCSLCGKQLDKDFSSLSYVAVNESGQEEEHEFAKICKVCSDRLDQQEATLPLEIEDGEDTEEDWKEAGESFDPLGD